MLRSESIIMIREKVLEGKSAYAVSKDTLIRKIRINKVIRHVHRNLIRIKMRSINL